MSKDILKLSKDNLVSGEPIFCEECKFVVHTPSECKTCQLAVCDGCKSAHTHKTGFVALHRLVANILTSSIYKCLNKNCEFIGKYQVSIEHLKVCPNL